MTAIIIFAVLVAVALVVQTVVLYALYRAMPENAFRMEGIIGRLEQQTSSILDTTHTILEDAEPKINEITSNVVETKATVQASLAHAAEAWDEITNRARTQAARLHEFVSRIASKARVTGLGHDAHVIADTVNEKKSSLWASAAR
jgi:uncharacterized protein YoxC